MALDFSAVTVCPSGKVPFRTRVEAKAHGRGAGQWTGLDRHGDLKPYLCGHCRQWHVGRGAPRKIRRKAIRRRGQ